MDSPLEQELDSVVKHIKAGIDRINQNEGSNDATEELITYIKHNNEYFVEYDGNTILHRFLYDGNMADNCPPKILNAILRNRPECIMITNGQDSPLYEFIRRNSTTMTRAIIEFMASDVTNFNLAKLGEEGERLFRDEVDAIDSQIYGEKVIQAAFNFYDKGKLLPLDIDLLEMLVKLATPGMLQKSLPNELSPLEQALRYDLCIEQPRRQLTLVRLILDKCEESITDTLDKGVKLNFGSGRAEVSSCARSVYQWHVATKKSWHQRRNEQVETDRRTHDQGPGAPPQRNGNSEPEASGVTGKDAANGTLPKPALFEKGGPSTSQHKFGKSSMSKRPPPGPGGLRPGVQHPIRPGPQKEGHRLQPVRMGLSNRRMANEARFTKQDIDAANEASETILRELGLRFLRWTLFNDGQSGTTFEEMIENFFGSEKHHYYFAMDATKVYEDMTESLVKSYFGQRKHYHVLRHVVLPRARIHLENESYTDQLQFFHWFRSWGVEKILKVVVDDRARPHGDEKIEEVLAGLSGGEPRRSFDVEVLDWRKEDLCPETVRTAAPQVRVLHLYWSGNNSVLRGWSEPEGLPLLKSLRTVHLSYNLQGVSRKRVEANVAAFKNRIQRPRPRFKAAAEAREEPRVKQPKRQPTWVEEPSAGQKEMTATSEDNGPDAWLPGITVHVHGLITSGRALTSNSTGSAEDAVEQRWFKYVEDFVSMIPSLPASVHTGPHLRRVRVALIDDGVDIFSKGMRTLQWRFLEGRSFDQTTSDGPNPVFSSFSGHGTFMAKSILRVCPFADIVPYRLAITPDPTGKLPRPEPGSAAKAIRAAILQGVDIISMSWTIRTDDKENKQDGMSQLLSVVAGARRDGLRIPIMFCAASDDGNQGLGPGGFPHDIDKNIFCIGAADSSGQVWPKVTDQSGPHFIFPGVDIKDVFGDDKDNNRVEAASKNGRLGDLVSKNGRTGSSVATALAAGLAALLIHCTKLGFYYTQECKNGGISPTDTISSALVNRIATFAGMKHALTKLAVDSRSGTMYANPADDFSKATKGLKDHEMDGLLEDNLPRSLGPIATLCRNICEG